MKYIKVLLILIIMVISNADAKMGIGSDSVNSTSQAIVNKCDVEGLNFWIEFAESSEQSSQRKLLNLTIKNGTSGQIIFKELVGGEGENNYSVEVKNSKGEIIPYSEQGKKLTKPRRIEISVVYTKIKVGEEVKRIINLANLYKLENGQTYNISVRKSVFAEVGKCYQTVVSNTVKVKL